MGKVNVYELFQKLDCHFPPSLGDFDLSVMKSPKVGVVEMTLVLQNGVASSFVIDQPTYDGILTGDIDPFSDVAKNTAWALKKWFKEIAVAYGMKSPSAPKGS